MAAIRLASLTIAVVILCPIAVSPANMIPVDTGLWISFQLKVPINRFFHWSECNLGVMFLQTEQCKIWLSVPVKCTVLTTVSRQQMSALSKYQGGDRNWIHLHAVVWGEGALYSSQNKHSSLPNFQHDKILSCTCSDMLCPALITKLRPQQGWTNQELHWHTVSTLQHNGG